MIGHDWYNKEKFPVCVGPSKSKNFEIWANETGYCAAIPTDEGAADGCKATHFGDARYVQVTLGLDVMSAISKAHS